MAWRRQGSAADPAGSPFGLQLPVFPVLDLALGLGLRDAVLLLDLADQLFALAVDLIEIVVGKLAPLLLDLAFELLPVALNLIPVHAVSPLVNGWDDRSAGAPAFRPS